MNPQTDTTPFGTPDPTLHLEYLYGPQWREVTQIVERAAQLTAEEREKLNNQAEGLLKSQMSALSGNGGGLSDLLSNLTAGTAPSEPQPTQIAADTAREFGRSRNIQIAGITAGQAVSPGSGTGSMAGVLNSLSSIGVMAVVSQAVTATVLADLVGQGRFTQDVYDGLIGPWRNVIF
ncbi:hypothetical protein [Nocardia pseudobrasiliensis]|uniref:Uncharacterized protein n=1 Tax=Nocardia pseudobrasiliensis TaxID=45979 RepID=A0A370ICM9_9NOCA|nr:hypothetical protein [Nocardia pseudobrasiliensis]RDI68360.1 hypothetical protein DFR76_102761 [Nocardia pseudobrasiliensis]